MKKAQIELCHWSSQLCKKLQDNNNVINYIFKKLKQRGATWGARKTTMKRTFQDIILPYSIPNSFFSITYLPLFFFMHTICPFPQFFPFFFVELTSLSQPLFWILEREEEKKNCNVHCIVFIHPFSHKKFRVRNKMRVLYCYLHLHNEKNVHDSM